MAKTAPYVPTKDEMDNFLTVCSNNMFYHTLFTLAKNTGRRLGEYYGVEKKEKIDSKVVGKKKVYTQEGNQIEVDKTRDVFKATGLYEYGLKGKDFVEQVDDKYVMNTWVLKRRNYVQDETFLNEATSRLVRNYLKKFNIKDDDYVFRKKSYRAIQNAVKSYAKKAGIKGNFTFHSFRHYFVTHLLKQGWSHNEVAKVTGHKSVASISSYDHVLSKDLKDKLGKALESS